MDDINRELINLWRVSCSQQALHYPRVVGFKPLKKRFEYRVFNRAINGNWQTLLKTGDRSAALTLHETASGSWIEMWDMVYEEKWAETGRASKDTLALIGLIRRELGHSKPRSKARETLLAQFDVIYRTAFLPNMDQ